MRPPTLRATIERRLLVNYRVDADVLASILPRPFRPALVCGSGMAGICLIRLGDIRPSGVPAVFGLIAENAAHRVAVERDAPGGRARGVYIPRRDTSSRLVAPLGGRAFPGWHHLAQFEVEEEADQCRIGMDSRDREVSVRGIGAASGSSHVRFGLRQYQRSVVILPLRPVGYAATPRPGDFDGVELGTCGWGMHAMDVEEARSSFFDDASRFPPGTASLDSAFLMEGLETTWKPQPRLLAEIPA